MSENLSAKILSKIKFGGFILTNRDQFAIFTFGYLQTKNSLCVNGDNAKWPKKGLKVWLTHLIIIQIEKTIDSFYLL